MTNVYIRPLGLLWGEDADHAVAEAAAGRIAGGGGCEKREGIDDIRRESDRMRRLLDDLAAAMVGEARIVIAGNPRPARCGGQRDQHRPRVRR